MPGKKSRRPETLQPTTLFAVGSVLPLPLVERLQSDAPTFPTWVLQTRLPVCAGIDCPDAGRLVPSLHRSQNDVNNLGVAFLHHLNGVPMGGMAQPQSTPQPQTFCCKRQTRGCSDAGCQSTWCHTHEFLETPPYFVVFLSEILRQIRTHTGSTIGCFFGYKRKLFSG